MPSRLLLLLLAVAALPSQAEKADRTKPLVFTADQRGEVDGVNQRTELQGNVIITQGSLALRAEKVDLRETRDGYHQAYANGKTGQPVSFRQARDLPGEAIDGIADQLEYDTRTEIVRFIGNTRVRLTRGATVVQEVTGAALTYDSRTERFIVEGGDASANPGGRVRIVRMPPPQPEAASVPASAPLPLQPSTTLTPPPKSS